MERLVLGVSSVILFLSIACQDSQNKQLILKNYSLNQIQLTSLYGKVYDGNKLFSGNLFSLNAKKDTLFKTTFVFGLKEGTEIKRYDSGQIREKRHYKNGLQNGLAKGWYENGKPMFEYYFKNEAFHGSYKEWYDNGNLYRNQHFVNGLEYGTQQVYEKDGTIKINYVIKEGRRYGLLGTKNCKNASEKNFK